MKLKLSILALFILVAISVKGAVVDTLAVYSEAMKKNVQVVVVSPENNHVPKPVVYLLHGYGGNAKTWLSMKPELKDIADRDGLIFVCPDGVSSELVKYIDSEYSTVKDRSGRAITGLSMGGHGAMWLSFRHKDVFGAAGSTSGGVDIRPFPNNWEMNKLLGNESDNQEVWNTHTAIMQIDRIKNGELAIIFDCGYSDFFFEVNNDFHKKLLKYKIDHDFLVRPGSHNGEYWKNSIDYQILFFKKFFDKNKGKN